VTGGTPTFPVVIGSDPVSRTVKVGDRVSFVVGSSGTSLAYQWRFNGVDISGATASTYTLTSAQTTNAGNYKVVVTNSVNALTSATLTGTALTRSADKRLMTLAAYNASLGNSAALQGTASTAVPRAVVTIDGNSQMTLAVADTNAAYSGAHFRGAATDGANNF